jgi:hypothetical protein
MVAGRGRLAVRAPRATFNRLAPRAVDIARVIGGRGRHADSDPWDTGPDVIEYHPRSDSPRKLLLLTAVQDFTTRLLRGTTND